MAASSRTRQLTIAIACVILLAIGAVVVYILKTRSAPAAPVHTGSASAVLAALANKPPPAPTTAPQLHVGLYLSKITGEQWGYSIQIIGELSRGDFDLVPILEPGSESVAEIQ